MDHAARVRGGERGGDLLADLELLLEAQARADDAQGLALDELEREEVAVGAFEQIVDPADVGMVELGEDPRLAQETPAGLGGDALLGADRL
jgi:hypothetical protein